MATIIDKSHLTDLLALIATEQDVYIPAIVSGNSQFVAYGEGVEPRLDLLNTKLPPKELLFPATERMYRWKRHEGHLTLEQAQLANKPFTLFGVRPCDVASIERLDQAFLTKGFVDEYYQARREAVTIVALACSNPGQTCFCDSMGGSPNEAPTADVILRETVDGAAWIAQAQTDKGRKAIGSWAPYAQDGDAPVAVSEGCTLQVGMDGVAAKLPALFESDLWSDIADTCVQCGTCTFVCPTCYCFDISQDQRADEGSRFRCWDSCMFTDYTLMAGGHNPRAERSTRVRQRFMHKLCYFEQRYGESLCVGCGRCIQECPAAVDITRIIDAIDDMPVASEAVAAGSEAAHA